MRLDVRFDAQRALASLSAYQAKVRDKALVKALNRTATTVRAVGARAIAAEMKPAKVTEVKKAISINFASRAKLVAVVRANGRKRIPLTAMGARPTNKGVTVRVGGKVYTIAHAFINKVRKGRRGVRIRAPDFRAQLVDAVKFRAGKGYRQQAGLVSARSGRRLAAGDYPIAEIMAPGVPLVFVQRGVMRAMRAAALDRFRTVLEQEVKYLANK
jgi:hypothetical protein